MCCFDQKMEKFHRGIAIYFIYASHNTVMLDFILFFYNVFTRTKGATVSARPLARQPDVVQECRETV